MRGIDSQVFKIKQAKNEQSDIDYRDLAIANAAAVLSTNRNAILGMTRRLPFPRDDIRTPRVFARQKNPHFCHLFVSATGFEPAVGS